MWNPTGARVDCDTVFLKQINVAQQRLALDGIIKHTAVVKIHRDISMFMHVDQKVQDVYPDAATDRNGQFKEPRAILRVYLSHAHRIRPVKDRGIAAVDLLCVAQPDKAFVRKIAVKRNAGAQGGHRFFGRAACAHRRSAGKLDKEAFLSLAHAKAEVARVLIVKDLKDLAIAREKGKIEGMCQAERYAIDALIYHRTLHPSFSIRARSSGGIGAHRRMWAPVKG